MSETIRQLRPRLVKAYPSHFWSSISFGVFNVVVGASVIQSVIFTKLSPMGIPLRFWGALFLVHGVLMLLSLATTNWAYPRYLHGFGVGMKSAWWIALVTAWVLGSSPLFLYVWSLVLSLQIIEYLWFPRGVGDAR